MKRFVILCLVLAIAIMFSNCGKEPHRVLSAPAQFSLAKELYDNEKYDKAQVEFENLIYTYPGNTVIDTAQYYLAMCYYNDKDYGLSAGEFQKLMAAYPSSEFADDAQYYIAMGHYKMSPKFSLDQTETYLAIDEFNKLFTDYSTSPFVSEGRAIIKELDNKLAQKLFMAGKLYLKLSDFNGATTYFNYLRDNYPSTDWAIQAFYYSGETEFKQKKYTEAKDIFEKFLLGFANHELASKAHKRLEEISKKTAPKEG